MKHAITIFKKQIKDTLKNKTTLIQFVMFPALTLIMTNTITFDQMPDHFFVQNFFVQLFATMYIGMAPLTSIAAMISEEKEQNTLRVLFLSNVKPHEYLIGTGSYVWLACMIGSAVICLAGSYSAKESAYFMLIMAVGILTSLLLGAAIGTFSKTQMMCTSLSVPVMLVFSFLPMLSLFNDTIAKAAEYTYSEQIRLALTRVSDPQFSGKGFCILTVNMLLFAGLFVISYRRSELA